MTKILPCPFCGGTPWAGPEVVRLHPTDPECRHLVLCMSCNVRLFRDTKDEAVKSWNRRVTSGIDLTPETATV